MTSNSVIPAKAGIQFSSHIERPFDLMGWIPAFAGMTFVVIEVARRHLTGFKQWK